jgi:hypothetical protein
MPGMQVLHCYHGLPLSQRGNVAATPGDRILPQIHLTIYLGRDTRVLGIASEPDQHRGCVCVYVVWPASQSLQRSGVSTVTVWKKTCWLRIKQVPGLQK